MTKKSLIAVATFGGLVVGGTVFAARSINPFTPTTPVVAVPVDTTPVSTGLIGKGGTVSAGRPTERDPFRPGVRSIAGPGELPFPG